MIMIDKQEIFLSLKRVISDMQNDLCDGKSCTHNITSNSKGLTPDQKRIHWEAYAKKTERQEEVFKKVFENVFNEQKDLVIAEIKRTGQLPPLDDDLTAKKFEPAIELVYHSAFEDAL